jgi:hypothetical protein
MCVEQYRQLKNETKKDTQIQFYKVIAAPVLIYGSKNCSPNRSERRKIETAEMCFLRHVSEYTLMTMYTILHYKFMFQKKESKITKTSGTITS